MTFSILLRDPVSGAFGGAAATGNLCVGGWVLRADPLAGISASQGRTPSTLWGDDVLAAMREGLSAERAVARIVGADAGRAARQLLAIGRAGPGAVFTGQNNGPETSQIVGAHHVAAGNMLLSRAVIEACQAGFVDSTGSICRRLLRALEQGASAGGDRRGMMSAAILVVSPRDPPISLRVDHSESPLRDLSRLVELSEAEDYVAWRRSLPTHHQPER